MGLDNGIFVRENELTKKLFSNKKLFYYYCGTYEIVYWRKCWNLREAVRNITGIYFDNNMEVCLHIDDVENLIKYLKSLNEKRWDGYNSIWTWDEYKPHIKKDIKKLKYLLKNMKKYSDLDVWFYDSY